MPINPCPQTNIGDDDPALCRHSDTDDITLTATFERPLWLLTACAELTLCTLDAVMLCINAGARAPGLRSSAPPSADTDRYLIWCAKQDGDLVWCAKQDARRCRWSHRISTRRLAELGVCLFLHMTAAIWKRGSPPTCWRLVSRQVPTY